MAGEADQFAKLLSARIDERREAKIEHAMTVIRAMALAGSDQLLEVIECELVDAFDAGRKAGSETWGVIVRESIAAELGPE